MEIPPAVSVRQRVHQTVRQPSRRLRMPAVMPLQPAQTARVTLYTTTFQHRRNRQPISIAVLAVSKPEP